MSYPLKEYFVAAKLDNYSGNIHVASILPDVGDAFVTKRCDHCGIILPGNTKGYCPGCGNIIATSRPAKRPLSEDPPAWMKQLETSLTNNRSNVPFRELNVKVWDEEETKDLPLSESEVHSVEDVPSSPGVGLDNGSSSHDPIEDIATRPYVAQPRILSQEKEKPVLYEQRQAMQASTEFMNSPAMQRPVTPVPLTFPRSQFPPAQPVRQTPPVSMPVPHLVRPTKNKRKSIAIVFGLLFILLLGGLVAWVIITQPFAVPAITNTTQNFNDTFLGVSLQYPQHWIVNVNKQNGTVRFYDDNQTDQVNITVVVADNQTTNQYMTKTASSLGMTGQKAPTTLSFAGATWQELQGSIQQSGANYTATLLATLHGEHYYTILQLAPSSTYPLEEQLVFSKMRSSFQF